MYDITEDLRDTDILLGLGVAVGKKPLFMLFLDCGHDQHKIKAIKYMVKAMNELNEARNRLAMSYLLRIIQIAADDFILFADEEYTVDDDIDIWTKVWTDVICIDPCHIFLIYDEVDADDDANLAKLGESATDFIKDMVKVSGKMML